MQKRLNLTKTVRKLPIDEKLVRKGSFMEDKGPSQVKYDDEHPVSCCGPNNCYCYTSYEIGLES